jgi:glycine dehydrogenase
MTHPTTFADRHIGPSTAEQDKMLAAIGQASLAALADAALPPSIRSSAPLDLPPALSEEEALAGLRELASRNRVLVSMIGLGWHDTVTPPVLRRGILESPGWYTAYTPYQPEISQGRLEALLNFQTVVADLTGLPTAGASLLDEATAAAEAMTLCRRSSKAPSQRFVADSGCHPQTLAVLATRAEPLGISVEVADLADGLPDGDLFGVLVSFPASTGGVTDHGDLVTEAHARGALVAVTTDLLALTLLRPPGEWGADIAVGSAQRFGVPLGFGGPHAGFMAVRSGLERSLPGRLVGVSVDADGDRAYRLALQTREQHIRRERATSNICTAQVLLAVIAGAYAAYHGPEGLTAIAERVRGHATRLVESLRAAGIEPLADVVIDTVTVAVPGRAHEVVAAALESGINLRLVDADHVGISCDERTTAAHVEAVCAAFGVSAVPAVDQPRELPEGLRRTTGFLTHPVFSEHRSETAMMRYLRRLSDRARRR